MASRIDSESRGETLAAAPSSVRVWDPLVRLFHWSLVAAFATAWIGEAGERTHERAGDIVLALLAIRLVWGVIGTEHARLASFVQPPAAVLAYLKAILVGHPKRYLGHNPAGGAMVVTLMLMVALVAGSGWLMTTNTFWGVKWVEHLHELSADATLALIVVHVLGVIVASLQHKENLVLAMITGRKPAA